MIPEQAARVFVGLGGNIGDRHATLRSAIAMLDGPAVARTRVHATSRVYETRAVGPSSDPFLNAAAELHSHLSPRELLHALLRVETAHGRERGQRWAARTLDLDIVLWLDRDADGDGWTMRVIDEPGLVVPHPRAAERDFVLRPLSDLLGDEAIFAGHSAAATAAALPAQALTVGSVSDQPL